MRLKHINYTTSSSDLIKAWELKRCTGIKKFVPFRLTRDMIDVMGVTGIEGVFRRCCEETLSVMRINKEALSTIVEETGEEMETSLEDSEDVYEGNKDAAYASLRVKQKLDQYEEGTATDTRCG